MFAMRPIISNHWTAKEAAMSSGHSLFSPSSAHRWMACPGSMAFPENQKPDGGSSTYADDGSATHNWAAAILEGEVFAPNATMHLAHTNKEYTLDEERAERIQGYVDDVRRRAIGGYLFVEQHVDLSSYLGANQGGTADVAIALPANRSAVVEDLKDGSEKVYASYQVQPATDTTPEVREPNPQLALYALGMLPDWELFGPIDEVLLVIYQPKLNHIDEFKITRDQLFAFGDKAKAAAELASAAMASGPGSLTTLGYLNPGKKQCRWCRAVLCSARERFIENETRADFDNIASGTDVNKQDTGRLARAFNAVPMIEDWCKAVKAEAQKQVAEGKHLIGPDGKPYKFVEGKLGDRKWMDSKAAEAALVAQLGPKAYTAPTVLTAPAASKILDKAKTKEIWKDLFEPMIKRASGRPMLVLGSDERPAFSGAGQAEDFEDDISV